MTTIELALTNIAATGEAIGRTADGLVLFVPHALPGEVVEAEIVHRRKKFGRGRLVRVVQASSQRTTPRCAYFGACGGCQWQHMAYPSQLRFKTQIVREQLTRLGKLESPNVRECIASPCEYGYRNHIQLVASPNGKLGFYAEGTHDVVEIDSCVIAEEAINQSLANRHTSNANLDLRTGLTEKIGSHSYVLSAASFFQVNSYVAPLLVNEVMAALNLQSTEDVLDLYCGVGLFTLPISESARAVLGVESSPSAVADARMNLRGHGNARLLLADVGQALGYKDVTRNRWDAIVLDPPRAGVAPQALVSLAKLHVAKLIYVSCDPATLARDLKYLCANGYTLSYAQPLDMFPQTHHVETVAVMRSLYSSE
jgi:23S rRNA (uracil1939-C5)-methyltransferase